MLDAPGPSELQLHQIGVMVTGKQATRKYAIPPREFANRHSDFVAGVAPGTVDAVFQHFVAEGLMFGDAKIEVLEECRNAGEEADALDSTGFGSIEEGADKQAPGTVSLGLRMNYDGADLGEMRAVDVKRSTADELVGVGFSDGEGVDVRTDFRVAPGEQGAVVGEGVDELVDGAGVLQ
jgi:hypothetical protein